jgi:tetratricopeptide (TPR) repeat protein
MQSNSSAKDGMQLLFDASIRVGNALVASGRTHKQDALKEYNDAVGIAEKIVSLSGDEGGDGDVIDARMKIGDVYKDNELRQYSEARSEYQSGLATCLAAPAKHPQSFNLLRAKGKAFYRIAELLRTERTAGTSDEARAFYRDASEVQNGLVSRNAQKAIATQSAPDSSLKSNLAATYTRWGLLKQEAGNLELALDKLRQGVALDEELTRNEPGNVQWQEFLTPNYLYLAQTFEGHKRPDEALATYRKLNDARRTLAYRTPGRSKPQKDIAEAAKLLGDRSTGLAQIEAYREAVRSWNRLIDNPGNADADADRYDVVLGFARTFDGKKDRPDAQSAYRVAMKIVVLNYVKDLSAASRHDKAEEAERASVVAGKAAETTVADTPH